MKKLNTILAALFLVAGLDLQAQLTEVFSYTNLNKAIPDGNATGLSDSRSVTSTVAQITALRVKLRVAGEFNGDLYGYVRHIRNGTTNFCVLLNRPGRTAANADGYDDTGLDITFSESAANGNVHLYQAVTNPAAGSPLFGIWQPDGRNVDPSSVLDTSTRTTTLTSFNGADGSGEWTLFLADLESGGTNMLTSWELELTGYGASLVNWPTPTNITYGTTLGVGQLNATSAVPGTITYTPAAGTALNAGSNQVLTAVFVPTDTANYLSTTSHVSLTVLPKALTITADNKTKVYGVALPAFTATYSGFTNGDSVASLTVPAALATTATSNSPAGDFSITVTNAVGSNYTITFVMGTLTITPAGSSGLLASSANPAPQSQLVTFTYTLGAVAPGYGVPGGTVQFKIDGSNAGSPVALSSGSASYGTSSLSHGTHTVVAEYAGDGNFTGTTNTLSPVQLINSPPVAGLDTIQRDATNVVKVSIATLLANDSDADGDTVVFMSVSSPTGNGATITRNGKWIYYTPSAGFTGADSFTYTISDGYGASVTGTASVLVRQNNGFLPNVAITDLGNGSYRLRFDGIPNWTYRLQYTTDVNNPSWQVLGTATENGMGIYEYTDTPPQGSPGRYYRSVYP